MLSQIGKIWICWMSQSKMQAKHRKLRMFSHIFQNIWCLFWHYIFQKIIYKLLSILYTLLCLHLGKTHKIYVCTDCLTKGLCKNPLCCLPKHYSTGSSQFVYSACVLTLHMRPDKENKELNIFITLFWKQCFVRTPISPFFVKEIFRKHLHSTAPAWAEVKVKWRNMTKNKQLYLKSAGKFNFLLK